MCLTNSFDPIRKHLGNDPEADLFKGIKSTTSPKEFCYFNKTPYFSEVLKECYALKYDEKPNYKFITFLLKKTLMEIGIGPGGVYS
jgi:hypothetical protein